MRPEHAHEYAADDFDRLADFDIDAYDDVQSDVAGVVAAFDPIFEPELLVEYLRVWAAGARTHASNLFDDVVAIEVESIACLEVQRLVERRAERTVRLPGDDPLPAATYDATMRRLTVVPGDTLQPETIEARCVGSEQRIACDCRTGVVACTACAGSGRTGATRACVACGTTGAVAHEPCRGSGVLVQYVHATITREVESACTMSRGSRGMARAADSDWLDSAVDAGQVLALLPMEATGPLHQAWASDPAGTVARTGTISALPIYRVTFRWSGKERRAWLIGAQLRVVVPGTFGRTNGWVLKRAVSVTMTAVSILMSLIYWQNQRAGTQPPGYASTPAGATTPAQPANPPPERVAVPK